MKTGILYIYKYICAMCIHLDNLLACKLFKKKKNARKLRMCIIFQIAANVPPRPFTLWLDIHTYIHYIHTARAPS